MGVIEYKGREWKVPQRHYSFNPDEAVFFYGGLFSNFVGGPFVVRYLQPWIATVELYQALYPTVEHFFQATKAVYYVDHEHIRNQRTASVAKQVGREIDLRQDWESVKFEVMVVGLRAKFADDPFRETLLATRDRFIAEDSPYDFEWGIRDAEGGFGGNNMLGKALMMVRDEIRKDIP